MSKLAVTLVRSPVGYRPKARATVRALGLKRLRQTVVVRDTDAIRGMISSVSFLVQVQPADGAEKPRERKATTMVIQAAAAKVSAAESSTIEPLSGSAVAGQEVSEAPAPAAPAESMVPEAPGTAAPAKSDLSGSETVADSAAGRKRRPRSRGAGTAGPPGDVALSEGAAAPSAPVSEPGTSTQNFDASATDIKAAPDGEKAKGVEPLTSSPETSELDTETEGAES